MQFKVILNYFLETVSFDGFFLVLPFYLNKLVSRDRSLSRFSSFCKLLAQFPFDASGTQFEIAMPGHLVFILLAIFLSQHFINFNFLHFNNFTKFLQRLINFSSNFFLIYLFVSSFTNRTAQSRSKQKLSTLWPLKLWLTVISLQKLRKSDLLLLKGPKPDKTGYLVKFDLTF